MDIDFEKFADGLVPTIVQDFKTRRILKFGYCNCKALKKTEKLGKVVFYDRTINKTISKNDLIENYLEVKKMLFDEQAEAILIYAIPHGEIYENDFKTCFKEKNSPAGFLYRYEELLKSRKTKPIKSSRTSQLFTRGTNQIAKKLGEETVELIIEAVGSDTKLFKAEASDTLYHFMLLLADKGIKLDEVLEVLKKRRV